MKRRIIALCMALCCVLSLFGCGVAKTVKSEQEIMADLQEKGMPEENPDAKITELEIIKRQTNAKDKQDLVYVTIQAEAETAKYVRSYQVEYGLYDDGWVLDDVSWFEDGENKTVPLTEPGSAELDQFFRNVNDGINAHNAKYSDEDEAVIISNPPYSSWEITSQETDVESGTATMYVQASRETPFLITHETMVLPWTFCEDGYWRVLQINIASINDAIRSIELDWSKLTSIIFEAKETKYANAMAINVTGSDCSNNTIDVDLYYRLVRDEKNEPYTGTIQYQTVYDLSDYQSCRDKIQQETNETNEKARYNARYDGRYVGDDFAPVSSTSLAFLSQCVYSDFSCPLSEMKLVCYGIYITGPHYDTAGWYAEDFT